MNTIQVTNPLCPQAYLKTTNNVKGLRPLPTVSIGCARVAFRNTTSLKLTTSRHKCLHLMPICSSRGEAGSGGGNQDPLWKSFGKALENFGSKPSVEGMLRQQIEKGEFFDEGGSGRTPPGGGGGGGGGGSFGESEDEGFSGVLDETIQVVLATLGFIFVYIYIINGAEIARLLKDYIKFLFGGRKSVRLTRALYQWERFWKKLTEKKEVDRYWLERAIINTPTWWDHPEKYKRLIGSYVQQKMQQSQSQSYDDGYESRSYDGYDSSYD